MENMRRIFVTGGAGFIGSCFVRVVLEELPSARVTNFDALTYAGNLDNLEGVEGPRHRFVRGDICDGAAVLSACLSGSGSICASNGCGSLSRNWSSRMISRAMIRLIPAATYTVRRIPSIGIKK